MEGFWHYKLGWAGMIDVLWTSAPFTHLPMDSNLDSGLGSPQVVSVTPSISEGVSENGRLYHSYGERDCPFPNDHTAQVEEIIKHEILLKVQKKLHFVNIPADGKKKNILDIGTGTGIWAIQSEQLGTVVLIRKLTDWTKVAKLYPDVEVLGVDLSPIQPRFVPKNVIFEVVDGELEWMDPVDWYDYIFIRHTVTSIYDLPLLFGRVFQ
jgi:SAM-dependent methyltransferase